MPKTKNQRKNGRSKRPAGRTPQRTPDDDIDEAMRLYRSAKILYGDKHYGQAAHNARRSLKLSPDMPASLLTFARASTLSENPQGAVAAYNRLIETKDNLDESQLYTITAERSIANCKAENHQDAEDDADRLIQMRPENLMSWCQRGAVRLARANYHGALRDLAHAGTLSENHPTVHLLTGETLANQAINQLDVPLPGMSHVANIINARRRFHTAIHHLHTSNDLYHDPDYNRAEQATLHFMSHAGLFHISPEGEDLPIPDRPL